MRKQRPGRGTDLFHFLHELAVIITCTLLCSFLKATAAVFTSQALQSAATLASFASINPSICSAAKSMNVSYVSMVCSHASSPQSINSFAFSRAPLAAREKPRVMKQCRKSASLRMLSKLNREDVLFIGGENPLCVRHSRKTAT